MTTIKDASAEKTEVKVTLKDVYAGKPDAKDEVLTEGYTSFIDSYIKPINFDADALVDGTFCFVSGFKGTGKTALLYYLDNFVKRKDAASYTSFIYFKGDYSDLARQSMDETAKRLISTISISNDVVVNGSDFECIWRWLFYQRLREDNEDAGDNLFVCDKNWEAFDKILRQIDAFPTRRKLTFPKQIRLKADLCSTPVGIAASPELELDFTKPRVTESKAYHDFVKYIERLDEIFPTLKRTDIPYYVFVDELEAYYGDSNVFHRDLRLIRDLIFTVKKLNVICARFPYKTKIICSVRTEIINAVQRFVVAKEMNKVTSGFEIPLVWNYTNTNSFEHPILKILIKRIQLAEKKATGTEPNEKDVIARWFPEKIDRLDPANYILNNGWNKPRDVVRLLLSARSCLCAEYSSFNQATFDMVRKKYSTESLQEIREEMRALYDSAEIDAIITCLTGFRAVFTIDQLRSRVTKYYPGTILEKDLTKILIDLYRLGVIGNYSFAKKGYRWQHKGDDQLILSDDWNIIIHPALQSILSVSTKRNYRNDRFASAADSEKFNRGDPARKSDKPSLGNPATDGGKPYTTAEITWTSPSKIGVYFEKANRKCYGVLSKKFLSAKALGYKTGDKIEIYVGNYDNDTRSYVVFEKR